jgi:hypothetical protein
MGEIVRSSPSTWLAAHASGPGEMLPEPDPLFDLAFDRARSGKLDEANQALSVALVAQARSTTEGRLSAAVNLLARLVAEADPEMTLGQKGAALRAKIMPNGWRHASKSWPRLRYAWREGLPGLLGVDPQAIRFGAAHSPEARSALAETLDELTRLNASDPEPVSVKIQDPSSGPDIGMFVGAAGLALSVWSIYQSYQRGQQLDRLLKRRSKR